MPAVPSVFRPLLRQPLDDMVAREPEAPRVMVEEYGEEERDGEEDGQCERAAAAERKKAEAEGEHHRALGHDDVQHYRADEEARLALKERAARGAVVAHVKG